MTRIKDWIIGVLAALGALLLALVGVQRGTINRQRADAERLERLEQQARSEEYERREQARAAAGEEARQRRKDAHEKIRNGHRTHFEQD